MRKPAKIIFFLGICAIFMLFSACGQEQTEASGEDSVVIYMGDPQSASEDPYHYEAWGQLLRSAADDAPEATAVILGGDLINEETDEKEKQAFLEAADHMWERIPFRSVTGNHTEESESWAKLFAQPQNGPTGHEASFYSFDAGNTHFIMMDSLALGSYDEETQSLLSDWIEKDLSAAKAPWKIAVMHHPMYSLRQMHKDQIRAETMQEQYLPILENGGVQILLCGHQHVYGRTVPMGKGEPKSGGIVQLMGVSGGKMYAAAETDILEAYQNEEPVYTILSANGKTLKGKTVGASGETIDSFTLEK